MFVASNTQDEGMPAYVCFDSVSLEANLGSPASFKARSGPGAGQIELSWNAVPGATGYELQRALGEEGAFSTLTTVFAPEAGYTDGGLVPGHVYRYRLRAVGSGVSGWSSVATAAPYLPSDVAGWRYLHFGAAATEEDGGDLADPDGDGLPNLLEYALGSSPLDPHGEGFAPEVGVREVGGEKHLTLTFTRDTTARHLRHRVESTDDLVAGEWTSHDPLDATNQLERHDDTPAPGLQRIVFRDPRPLSESARRFLRLRVERESVSGFYTGFETDSGYIVGMPVAGFDDPGIAGNAVWSRFSPASPSTETISAANPARGTQAVRIQKTDTSAAAGMTLDLSATGLDFTQAGPVTLRVSLAITSFSANTGNQRQLYLGDPGVNPNGGKYWVNLIFSEGVFYLYSANAAGMGAEGTSLGAAASYAPAGGHIAFEITFDPKAKTYGRVVVSGPNQTLDFTATTNGRTLPCLPASPGDPGKILQIVVGTNDTILADTDELSLPRVE